MPVELWTEEQLTPIERNTSKLKLSSLDLHNLLPKSDPILQLQSDEMKEAVDTCLDRLTTNERSVIKLRFGLEGLEMSLAEISEELGMPYDSVRTLESRALRKLRNTNNNIELIDCWEDRADPLFVRKRDLRLDLKRREEEMARKNGYAILR